MTDYTGTAAVNPSDRLGGMNTCDQCRAREHVGWVGGVGIGGGVHGALRQTRSDSKHVRRCERLNMSGVVEMADVNSNVEHTAQSRCRVFGFPNAFWVTVTMPSFK